jgi:hypothetical protein
VYESHIRFNPFLSSHSSAGTLHLNSSVGGDLARISHKQSRIGPSDLVNVECKQQHESDKTEDPMRTDCNSEQIEFQALGFRKVEAQFDGGDVTSDGGGLLLREVEARRNIIERFARCFRDHRNPEMSSTVCFHWYRSASMVWHLATRI